VITWYDDVIVDASEHVVEAASAVDGVDEQKRITSALIRVLPPQPTK